MVTFLPFQAMTAAFVAAFLIRFNGEYFIFGLFLITFREDDEQVLWDLKIL